MFEDRVGEYYVILLIPDPRHVTRVSQDPGRARNDSLWRQVVEDSDLDSIFVQEANGTPVVLGTTYIKDLQWSFRLPQERMEGRMA
jgi:hypothetical protein